MAEKKTEKKESKDMKIGFHLGVIDSLRKERMELLKLVKIVEELMLVHANELKKLGVDITKKDAEKLEDAL